MVKNAASGDSAMDVPLSASILSLDVGITWSTIGLRWNRAAIRVGPIRRVFAARARIAHADWGRGRRRQWRQRISRAAPQLDTH